jgi:UDP-glucose 4-epimerase
MPSRRILITGLSTFWGGRVAQALEADDQVEAIIGIDRTPPKVELDRTEFVQVADHHTLIRRIVQGAEIDTVVDTRLVTDSITTSPRKTHENNIIGTMNILAACTGPQTTVRKVVFRSSALYYGSEQDDPGFFTEDMRRRRSPSTPLERDVVEAEASVGDFAAKHPETTVTVLRFAHGLGPDMRTSLGQLLSLPVIPMILGFDPRLQFVHEDDIAGALTHAVTTSLPGIYNVAGDGVLALSEVAGLLGKPVAPLLPPWGTSLALPIARRLGVRIPPELLGELRFGRGLDNRRFKAAGYRLRHTSRETVELLREHQRIAGFTRDRLGPYRYEREVEDFLRWSPNVRREGETEWRPSRDQVAELRRALDALERADAPAGTQAD